MYWQDPLDSEGKHTGIHSFIVHKKRFIVDAKYTPIKSLGYGSFGVVCSCFDEVRSQAVAIKKIANALEDRVDGKRILRELRILRHMRHPNVLSLHDLIPPIQGHLLQDIYCVTDVMDSDLHKILYSKNDLSEEHIKYFMYQSFCALKYIHSAGVIHRDLKPSNVLVNKDCSIKVCDFGLSRGFDDRTKQMTEYVVTRWYRAPEVMCAFRNYDTKVDVWSMGCILAELYLRKPIFPGDDYIHQMSIILDMLGTPDEESINFITNQHALDWLNGSGFRKPRDLATIFPHASPEAIDLLSKLLKLDPRQRISVNEALAHPFFNGLRSKRRERECSRRFSVVTEQYNSRSSLRNLIWGEIYEFRPYLRQFSRDAKSTKEEKHTNTAENGCSNRTHHSTANASMSGTQQTHTVKERQDTHKAAETQRQMQKVKDSAHESSRKVRRQERKHRHSSSTRKKTDSSASTKHATRTKPPKKKSGGNASTGN